ncbi:peptidylprolyl isomerase [Nocardioides zeae]|uniref:Peptidyl-prolyl cis-trans isomerase n=1 Tax=Nocardioides zeae TaxID=1457234 RepID=A0A6P0HI74_9ACTN|nr:peptidylprolyl isomerase [Nocardioides zeae]NEN78402.1 peptidylprolyl isomerase [Nocardioides zeae]
MSPRSRASRHVLAVAALVAVPLLAGCGSDDGGSDSSSDRSSKGSSASASDGSSDGAAGTCEYRETGQAARDVDLPPSEPMVTADTSATIVTSNGDLNVTLFGADAPCTVGSFVSLAEQGFYDDTPCPRITTMPGFELLQCGDPTGTTSGGPGYEFDDELSGDETYDAGTLAMANAGPGTNGSQFFIVYGDTQLSPDYTVFGTVSADTLSVIEEIAADGDDGSNPAGGGAPVTPIDIESVTIG